jgi:hypothetical protein
MLEMLYEESVSYFKWLGDFDKIRNNNSATTITIESKKYVTSNVGNSCQNLTTFGVTILTNTATAWLIAEELPSSNSRKRRRIVLG